MTRTHRQQYKRGFKDGIAFTVALLCALAITFTAGVMV